jgi:hypothetical protein
MCLMVIVHRQFRPRFRRHMRKVVQHGFQIVGRDRESAIAIADESVLS